MSDCHCSFCGKQQDRVERLIAGPGVYICNECVQLCQEILEEGATLEAAGKDSGDVSARQAEPSDERRTDILTEEEFTQGVDQLSYRERRVLELLYGLSSEQPRTLDEVGATFKLTSEQLRRIEIESLTKLRSSPDPGPD